MRVLEGPREGAIPPDPNILADDASSTAGPQAASVMTVEDTLEYAIPADESVSTPPEASGPALALERSTGVPGRNGAPPATDFTRVVRDHFDAWDRNDDGILSPDDVRAAARDRSITGRPAAALATLVTRLDDIESLSDDQWGFEDGIHRRDLARIEAMAASSNADEASAAGAFANRMHYAERRVRNTHRALFADPMAGPSLSAMRQGMIGDCWVLASLGALVDRDPQAVVDMIEEQRNGNYRVTFPDGRSVTVAPPTDAELGFLGTAGADGLWVPVMEKAIGERYQQDYWFSTTELDHEPIGDGGHRREAIEILTGNPAVNISTGRGRRRPSDAQFLARLATAQAEGRIMAAGRTVNDDEAGIPKRHAYSVIDVNVEAQTVTIRNPWGNGEHENADGRPRDGRDDGVMVLSIGEFREWMDSIAIEQRD